MPELENRPLDPLVTVSILNHRRMDCLERALQSVSVQSYPSLEIIVVDNASGEEAAHIRHRYPQVRLIDLQENVGTSARNFGIQAARGEIIITLDNDVYLSSPFEVQHVVSAFRRHPRAGCVVFRIYHPQSGGLHTRDWCHPRAWREAENEEFETHYITEGAAAFQREVFSRIEPYWNALFIGHEGFDLGVRLLDAGYEIWYAPGVKVWHEASPSTRENWRPFYFNTRNLFLTLYRNYPWRRGFSHLLPRLGVLGFFAARHGFLRHFLRAMADGVRELPQIAPLRSPVGAKTLRKITELKRSQPGFMARLGRHWRTLEF